MRETRLFGIATALAPYTATQKHSHEFMTKVLEARVPEEEQDKALLYLDMIQESCGIRHRYSVIEDFTKSDPEEFTFFPKNWALEPFPTTKDRMEIYEELSIDMAEEAARKALEDSGFEAGEVTHLVVTTCTGLFAPGPDIHLVKRLGLRADTRRTIIGFMGCYGAFNGLRMADQIVKAEPEAVVLQVCVELCSLHYQSAWDAQTIIGNCLFGDGAAAAVYASAEHAVTGAGKQRGYRNIATTHCEITHDSLDQMQWHIGDEGFTMYLDVEIPRTLLGGGAAFVEELLHRSDLPKEGVDGWVVHPGGPKIIDAVRDSAQILEEEVALSRSVLSDYGNMSSGTVLFVLERQLRQKPEDKNLVMLGFGPGLTMEGAVLR